MSDRKKGIYEKYIKRLMDIVLSGIALIVFSPVLLIVSILILIKLGRPILFKQERPGLHEEAFIMYKFRTMTSEKDELGKLLPNELRHTKFGRFLRSTSMDELPELINIFKGDMSIVGPRPLLKEYLYLYNLEQKKRHYVRPGLTGLAQVNGRNTITWEEKFEYDVKYINAISFKLDIKIILLTMFSVLKRKDINTSTNITMERFKGTSEQESVEDTYE